MPEVDMQRNDMLQNPFIIIYIYLDDCQQTPLHAFVETWQNRILPHDGKSLLIFSYKAHHVSNTIEIINIGFLVGESSALRFQWTEN